MSQSPNVSALASLIASYVVGELSALGLYPQTDHAWVNRIVRLTADMADVFDTDAMAALSGYSAEQKAILDPPTEPTFGPEVSVLSRYAQNPCRPCTMFDILVPRETMGDEGFILRSNLENFLPANVSLSLAIAYSPDGSAPEVTREEIPAMLRVLAETIEATKPDLLGSLVAATPTEFTDEQT